MVEGFGSDVRVAALLPIRKEGHDGRLLGGGQICRFCRHSRGDCALLRHIEFLGCGRWHRICGHKQHADQQPRPDSNDEVLGKRFIDGVPPLVSQNRRSVGRSKLVGCHSIGISPSESSGVHIPGFSRDRTTYPGSCCVCDPLGGSCYPAAGDGGVGSARTVRLCASGPGTPPIIQGTYPCRTRATDILTYLLSRISTCARVFRNREKSSAGVDFAPIDNGLPFI